MIEEIEDIVYTGDPENGKPKPKFDPNKPYSPISPSPKPKFDPNANYEPVDQGKPQYQLTIETPDFKPKPATGGAKTFTFEAPADQTAILRLQPKVDKAKETLIQELKANYDVKKEMIQRGRMEKQARQTPLPVSDQPKTSAQLAAERFLPKQESATDAPVTDEDLKQIDDAVANDTGAARRLLERTMTKRPEKAKEIQKNLYLVDVHNTLDASQESLNRIAKIEKNASKIEKGIYKYDVRTGTLAQPVGMVGSFMEGWKQKENLYDAYDFLQGNDDDAAIASWLDDRKKKFDPDEAVVVPKHKVAEITQGLGTTPVKTIGAAGLGSLAGPVAGAVAGAAVGGVENAKMEYAANFQRIYYELLDQGVDRIEAVKQARSQAQSDAAIGFVTGAATGLIGSRIGLAKAPIVNFSHGFKQAAVGFIKRSGGEGLLAGAIGAGGEIAKNKLAQSIGIDRDLDEGAYEALEANLMMTVGLAAAIKAGKGLTKPAYKTLLHGMSKVPDNIISENLNEKVQSGEITQKAADETIQRINEYKGLDALIPDDVTEEARFKIQDKILKRVELETELENTDKAFHEPVKEKIKSLNEEILGLAKEKEKPVKPESGLTKEQEKEAAEFADELLNEGIISDIYEETVKKDPIGFFRTIAQQAQKRDEQWRPLKNALREQAIRDQYGDTVVDYAMELFPAPKIEEPQIIPDAIQEQSAGSVLQHTQETIGEKGSERSGMEPGKQGEAPTGTRAEETSNVTGEEEIKSGYKPDWVFGKEEGATTGITHAEMNKTAREFGLAEYEGDPETVAGWDAEAKSRMQRDPDAMNKLFDKLRNGGTPDAPETRMMIAYMADLKAKYNAMPTPELLNDIKRAKDLFNIVGREQGKAFRARKDVVPVEETLADYHLRDVEYNKGAPLTEQQEAQSTKEYQDISAAKQAYEEKIATLEADNARLRAEAEIKKAKAAKKPGEKRDYKAERKDILDNIKKKWDESKGQASATFVPYAEQLIKIAPDVVKLVKNIVDEGIDKLPDVIRAVHSQIKGIIPEITEKDIHNIIAGEYNEKKPKRSEVAEKVFDLKLQAKLVNRLEALEAGMQPKNERQRIKRNQEIEELRKKIRELTPKADISDAQKLSSLKNRYKSEIAKLEEQLKKGDFEPEEKKEIPLDKEAIELKDQLLKLKEDREIRLMKMDYEGRSKAEKAARVAGEIVNVGRVAKSSFDVSMPYRQGLWGLSSQLLDLPIGDNKGFVKQKQLASEFGKMYTALATEKHYRRIMAEIYESPRFKMAQEAGLNIIDPLSRLEEQRLETHGPSIAQQLPLVGKGFAVTIDGKPVKIGGFSLIQKSERAATAFVNTMKWNIFNNFVDMFEKQGKTFKNSADLYKAAADYANQSVGQGKMPEWLKKASPVTSKLFFSLKLQASRLQLLTYLANPRFYTKVPKEIRVAYLKDMAKFVALGMAIIGTAKAFGLSVGANPYQSDFGKIKVGDTQYDVWGGFTQWATFLTRLIGGKAPDKGGHIKDANRLRILGRFARSKASPEAGAIVNILDEKDYLGRQTNLKKEALNFITPLMGQDVYEAGKDGGVQQAIITAILAGHGVGVQTYDNKKKK